VGNSGEPGLLGFPDVKKLFDDVKKKIAEIPHWTLFSRF